VCGIPALGLPVGGRFEEHAEQRYPGTDYSLVFSEEGYQLVRLER
jgi:hypothetical protein